MFYNYYHLTVEIRTRGNKANLNTIRSKRKIGDNNVNKGRIKKKYSKDLALIWENNTKTKK